MNDGRNAASHKTPPLLQAPLKGIIAHCCDILNGTLDLIYPPKCVVCGALQPLYLCQDCLEKIDRLEPPICDRCGRRIETEHCIENQCPRFAFAKARSVGVYDGVLREVIHQLKYGGHKVVAPELGQLLTEFLSNHPSYARGVSCVIPVPVDPLRERARGFNQSALLARSVAEYLSVPLAVDILRRCKTSRPQVDLPLHERIENVRGVFQAQRVSLVSGKQVLLVDDVLTTGSTASEAAKALRDAGAASVYVLTLARSC